jgi:hypothetical protein
VLTAWSKIFYHLPAVLSDTAMARKLDFIVFGVPRSGSRFAGASKALAGFQRMAFIGISMRREGRSGGGSYRSA